jgi:hypothetical protein
MSVTINGTTGITTPSLDNDGGTIDGTTIGGATAAAGSFTTVSAISAGSGTPGAGQLSIGASTASYEKATLRIDNSGNSNLSIDQEVGGTATSRMFFQRTTGYVGIGTTTPSYQLQLSTDSAGKPSSSTWTVVSDERIKTDIIPADLDRCYEIVKTVPLKRYSYADGVYTDEQIQDKQVIGWIAQDVQQVFAKAVSVKPFTKYPDDETRKEVIEDCLDLNGSQMYAAMYGAVQKLMQKVEALETEVLLLKGAM